MNKYQELALELQDLTKDLIAAVQEIQARAHKLCDEFDGTPTDAQCDYVNFINDLQGQIESVDYDVAAERH